MTVPYYCKVLGGPTGRTISEAKALPPPQYGSAAGPFGVDQVDGARLELAMSAGRAAIAAGYGASSRADGKLECNHCVKCDLGRPDLCRQPMEPVVAKALAGKAQADRIAQAEADAAELARVIWHEQARRGLAL
jgi:hypothetical protein